MINCVLAMAQNYDDEHVTREVVVVEELCVSEAYRTGRRA
jgi:hypothetical protein